jgi:hypothetical protein
MNLGPTLYLKCTNESCSHLFKHTLLLSGNTFGSKLYSDSKRIAPMLPDEPTICKCPSCGTFSWMENLLEREAKRESFLEEVEPTENSSTANFLTIEECVEALTIPTIVSDKNTEIQLRMLLMLTFNDRIRNGEKLFQKETDQTIWLKNLYDLKDLLDLTIDFNCIIVADIFRYLGKFEEAQELLAPFKNSELNWVTNQIEAQCIEKNTSVFELLMPNN